MLSIVFKTNVNLIFIIKKVHFVNCQFQLVFEQGIETDIYQVFFTKNPNTH